jgi:glycosyltransferase involved in cell wall biosynthesis
MIANLAQKRPPLRVLFLTDFLMAGGVERQFTELLTRLDKTRIMARAVCLYGPKAGRSLHFAPRLEAANVPLTVLDAGWGAADKARIVIGVLQAAWAFRPHVIHTYNYHGNLLSRLARPLLPPATRLVGAVRSQNTTKQLLYERLSWRLCQAIVVNGPHLQQQIIKGASIPPNRVILIPNGIDMLHFSHNPDPALRARLSPEGRIVALITRIAAIKAPQVFIRSVGILAQRGDWPAQVRVVIVGEREDKQLQAEIDQIIVEYRLQNTVIQIDQTQPEAYYHAADFTVLPSLSEGLPNVMLESLAAGRPVLITEGANAAGVIQDGVTGWIARTGDADHLAEVLLRALHTDVESMRGACRAAAAEFSMEKMVERYTALYERLAGYSTA